MSQTTFPARIHVLLATDAPVGLVIRKGPSKQVATIGWNLKTDQFELGQWLKGRIYERRSDLSPDGKYFIYMAMNGRWHQEAKGAWTAISRRPYLKALTLHPKGDCWNGGGLWTDNGKYWLNDGYGHQAALYQTSEVKRDSDFVPTGGVGSECLGVYYPRLLRDGWQFIERQEISKSSHIDIFEKRVSNSWVIRKVGHGQTNAPAGKSCYWDEHVLVNKTGTNIECPDWEWADVRGGALLWAEAGKLYRGRIKGSGLHRVKEIYDFNPMKFSAITAPY
ncbi:MAG: hypothetical protein AAF810_08315 [Cyanobacteria bacterium P01_D01_bin.36]